MRWNGDPVWRIEYNDVAEYSLLSIDKPVRQRILSFMRDRVEPSHDPKLLAEALKGDMRGLWRFLVGDYRVVCDIQTIVRVVEVLDVGHRSKIYRKPIMRIVKPSDRP